LTIDDFLLQSPAVKQEADFQQYATLFNDLPKLCNDYAKRQIAKQRAFFEKYQLTALVNFYDELERLAAGLPPSDFLLRLSWGSGWQGMTGELIENPDDLQRIRRKFNLGKLEKKIEIPEKCPECGSANIRLDRRDRNTGFCQDCRSNFPVQKIKKVTFPIFPKTRKIALEAGQPRYPFGWVRFCSAPPEIPPAEERRQFVPPAYRQTARPVAQTARPSVPPPPIPQPAQPQRQPAIRPGDKLRAEVIKHDGDNYTVRLLEKDPGRELNFTRAFIPVVTGDTVEVRVKSTNPAGDEITKIEFVSKVKK
jgi:CRISPR-associated protein Csm5